MEERPNPEKLLKLIQEEERQQAHGKLKIYLGAAPGVGKTYTMLEDAIAKRLQGLDVVVGVVESHRRQEIEWLLKDFDILPRQPIQYRGKELLEFDLDAALKRHPGLILMDEMAHTNVAGLRHAKRWQDIKELLDRGIDVYTTLNVQHIESLNDIVSQVIHTPVKETVPDSILDMADTIELIDLPPEDLLKRLHEGKIYFPQQAELAAEHFFRKGNLIALRELALRFTAERVGAQVLLYRQGQGIKHVWPTKEKILVCVGKRAASVKLIRAARRMAKSLQAEWIAVHIDTPKLGASEKQRNIAIQNLRIAEQLGAETKMLMGFDLVQEIMTFAREQNITKIIIGKKIRPRWRNWLFRSLVDEVLRHSGEIDVYIITNDQNESPSSSIISTPKGMIWKIYGTAILTVTVLTLLSKGLVPANFQYFFSLLVMFLVAVISHLTILTRRQAEMARLAERRTATLHTLSRRLASTRGIDKLLDTAVRFIGEVFDSEVLALLPNDNNLVIRAFDRSHQVLSAKEQGVAQWVYDLGQTAGLGTDTLPFSDAIYVPLITSQGSIGVLRVHPTHKSHLFTPEETRVLEACANQIALAVEVDKLQEQNKNSELKMETDRVRSSLLQSVSHDLRTPLVAVMGAASTLMEMSDTLDKKKIKQLGNNIYTELEQLSRLINNLLQMTYLEAESVKLQKERHKLIDVVTVVLKTFGKKLEHKPVQITISPDLPQVPFDRTLIEEVFFNLIENAIKFTPADSLLDISASIEVQKIRVCVADRGPGIVPDEVNKLFEKFYRGRLLATERGLGLGLAICRSIIKAHGGDIWAENRADGGASFCFTLPLK